MPENKDGNNSEYGHFFGCDNWMDNMKTIISSHNKNICNSKDEEIHICTYKYTTKCHSQTTSSSPEPEIAVETFLEPSADNQTRKYDTDYS